jgi:hypothetical protein
MLIERVFLFCKKVVVMAGGVDGECSSILPAAPDAAARNPQLGNANDVESGETSDGGS